jgi:DNA gyrase subunit A
MKTREEEAVGHLIVCDTHDSLLLFTQTGKVYSIKGYEVPEGSRQARGIPVVNLVDMDATDRVTAVVVVKDFSRDSLLLSTANGQVKRTPLDQFESVRRAGLIAMRLDSGDQFLTARAASDDDDVIIISSDGRAMRFGVGTLRVASRSSGGVRGMKLRDKAQVIALIVAGDGDDLLVVTEHGAGKRTPMDQYPRKGRGGQGMLTFRISDRTGPLAVARAVRTDQEVILVSRDGIVMRTRAEQISRQGRTTQGVSVMNLGDDDAVASIAQIEMGDETEEADAEEATSSEDE